MEGMIFTLFAIAIAAAETAIAISIIINIYREVGNSDVASVKQNEILRHGHYTSHILIFGDSVPDVPHPRNRRCEDVAQAFAGVLGIPRHGLRDDLELCRGADLFLQRRRGVLSSTVCASSFRYSDVTWLAFTDRLRGQHRLPARSHIRHDAGGDHHHLFYGTPLQLGIHGA